MKPSQTALQALNEVQYVRSDGNINTALGNVLLALIRKEISATDALAIASVTDAMCNVANTSIKERRLQFDVARAANERVKLVELGHLIFTGEGKQLG